jgi:PAS domain S-box-containing protein
MSWPEILDDSCKTAALETLRQAAIDRNPFSFEVSLKTALGTSKSVRVVGDCPRSDILRGFIIDNSGSNFINNSAIKPASRSIALDLENADKQQAELFDSIPFPAICYDWESGRIVEANKTAVIAYGYSREDFSDLGIADLWSPGQQDSVDRLVNCDRFASITFEATHVRRDGTHFDVEICSHPLTYKGTNVRVAVSRDISQSKRVERHLRLSNERLSLLATLASAVVGSLPLDKQAELMAKQIQEAFQVDGCVVRLIKGDSLELLASSGIDKALLVQNMPYQTGLPARVMNNRKPVAVLDVRESGELPPDNSEDYSKYSFVSYAGAPLVFKDQCIGVVAIFSEHEPREFTEVDLSHLEIVANNMAVAVLNSELYEQLNRQRDTLEASEERLRLVTEASTDGIWEWDRATDSFTWSDRVYALLGVEQTTKFPPRASALEIVHPEDRKAFFIALIRNVRERGALRREVKLQRGDGSYGQYEAYGQLVCDKNNRPVRMVGSLHDITDRVQRDRELEAVAAISLALRDVETTREMLPLISEQIARILGLASLGLALVDSATDTVVIRHASGVFSDLVGARFQRGEGLIGRVFADAKVKFAPDLRDEPAAVLKGIPSIPTAVLGVPLVARGEVIGVLWLGKTAGPGYAHVAFNPGEARLLSILAEIAAASLRRTGLRDRTDFHLRRLRSLSIIHATVSENRDLRTTLTVLLDQLRSQTGIDAAAIHLQDEEMTSYRVETSIGFEGDESVPNLGRELIVNRYRSRLVDLLESGARGRRFAKMIAAGYQSYLAVPLIANEQILGLLEIFHKSELPQNVDLDNFAEMLATQAAIAVDNTNLLRSLRTANRELTAAYDATIEGWARALDLRDHETEGHTRRVTEMTVELAKLMSVPPHEISHMRRGALLHDIGKMAIPDSVLLKPGQLDQNEWVVMRRHPGIALDLLEPVNFLKPAIDIPFCHHEKWDGTGYPRGLKGKEIPLSARIFAVIDVWDALRSDRPYRKGWSAEQAVHFIRVQSGKHFDPDVVEVFLNNRELIDCTGR